MGAEGDAFFVDFPELCKGKDLKTAAVSENGALPPHKFVEAS